MKSEFALIFLAVGFIFSCESSEKMERPGNAAMIDLPILGKVLHRNSLENEANPWGIQAGSLDENVLEKAAEIVVKWTRLHTSWEHIEKEKGI